MGSLRIVGVRDWRVYGVFALWPQVIGEIRVSHLTPFLCLLLALVWRYRDTRFRSGLALGLAGAIKFFLWPVAIWLGAIGRLREVALAAAVAAASLLLVLPFTSLHDYFRVLVELGHTFDQESYSPFGFLMQVGAPEALARVAMFAVGAVLLVASWRRASLGSRSRPPSRSPRSSGSTTTRSRRSRSRSSGRGSRGSGSHPSRPGDS